jgi:sortase A
MSNRLRRTLAGAATAAAVVIFFTTAVRALFFSPEEELPTDQAAALVPISPDRATPSATSSSGGSFGSKEAIGVPARLTIPSVGVDAAISDVGLGKTGNMAVPRTYSGVGWYRYGPRPGEQGSAVIDGHLDNGFGLDAVFRHLGDLKVGSDMYVKDAQGKSIHFIVSQVRSYNVKDVPLDLIFNKKDGAYLNLITCDGAWSLNSMSYDKRLVVFAKRTG